MLQLCYFVSVAFGATKGAETFVVSATRTVSTPSMSHRSTGSKNRRLPTASSRSDCGNISKTVPST